MGEGVRCGQCGREGLETLRDRLQERVDRPGRAGLRWFIFLKRIGIRVRMGRARSMADDLPLRVCSLYEVHHILPVSLGGTAARHNLITLCVSCHKRETIALLHGNRNARRRER